MPTNSAKVIFPLSIKLCSSRRAPGKDTKKRCTPATTRSGAFCPRWERRWWPASSYFLRRILDQHLDASGAHLACELDIHEAFGPVQSFLNQRPWSRLSPPRSCSETADCVNNWTMGVGRGEQGGGVGPLVFEIFSEARLFS